MVRLLESYTTLAGMTNSPIMSIDIISYFHSPWVDTLQQNASKFNAKILIPQLKHIKLLRQFDQPIMNSIYINHFYKSEQEMINACGFYLQANTLAEISNHQGSRLLECVLNCEVKDGIPTLFLYSKSKSKTTTQKSNEAMEKVSLTTYLRG
jgi:hypothetical protein